MASISKTAARPAKGVFKTVAQSTTAAVGSTAAGKGAVGKVDVHALRQQPAPQHADLLALGDAVGGDEGGAGWRAGFMNEIGL